MSPLFFALLISPLLAPARGAPPTEAADAAPTVAPAPPTARVTASLVLRVDDKDAAAQATIAAARAAGGWFSSFSTEQVTIRVPWDRAEPVIEQLRGLGELVDRSYGSEDLSAELADLDGRIAARRGVLKRYEEALAKASSEAVVSVEREITRVVSDIEGLEGRRRLLRDQVQNSSVTVAFRYRERDAPVRDGSSSFDWLNTMNVADLLFDLQQGRRAARSRVELAVAPQGFAPFDRPARFQALSPDDVAFRIRSAPNEPEADLAFWAEALRTRMLAAGYHLDAEAAVAASGTPGALLELGAANGPRDQSYLVALFVDGPQLILVEATGEAERLRPRRDAILAAIGALRL